MSKLRDFCGPPGPLLLIGVILAGGFLVQRDFRRTQTKIISALHPAVNDLPLTKATLAELLSWHRVHPIPRLSYTSIAHTRIKTLDGPIDYSIDVAEVSSVKQSLEGWMPKSPEDLPIPWPIVAGARYVSPYIFAQIASILASRIKDGAFDNNAEPVRFLMRTLAQHSVVTPTTASFIYRSDWEAFDTVIPGGWKSAFGDAAITMGLCELYEATHDADTLALAQKYATSLLWKGEKTDTLNVDDAGYLWFEEYPKVEGRFTHVLNAEIFSTFALMKLVSITGDHSYEPMIRAGLATSARYIFDVRNPGNRSYYNVGGRRIADYGPQRMVIFAAALSDITGNPIFAAAKEALMTDE